MALGLSLHDNPIKREKGQAGGCTFGLLSGRCGRQTYRLYRFFAWMKTACHPLLRNVWCAFHFVCHAHQYPARTPSLGLKCMILSEAQVKLKLLIGSTSGKGYAPARHCLMKAQCEVGICQSLERRRRLWLKSRAATTLPAQLCAKVSQHLILNSHHRDRLTWVPEFHNPRMRYQALVQKIDTPPLYSEEGLG